MNASHRPLLDRRNPSVKLGLLFVVSAAMLFVWDPLTPALLYLGAVPAVLMTTTIGLRTLAVAHLPFAGFALGLLAVNLVSRPLEEGLLIGSSLALRTLLVGVLSVAFVTTTDPVDLMTSLHQQARLRPRVTYALLAGYRMLQKMPREWETIRQAQAIRGQLRADGSLPRDPTSLCRASFALLVHSLREAERIAQTLESRGLGLLPRTNWRSVPVSGADAALVAVVLAAFATAWGTATAVGLRSGVSTMWGG